MKPKITALLISVALVWGCTDFWGDGPQAIITQDNFYKSDNDIDLAVTGLYSVLISTSVINSIDNHSGSWSGGLFIAGEAGTDYGTFNNTGQMRYQDLATYDINTYNAAMAGIWATQYFGINAANMLLARVDMDRLSPVGMRYVAEARFMRAYFYTCLVRMFGGVPLLTEPSTPDNLYPERAPLQACYELINSDFTYAYLNLPETQNRHGRATKWTAAAYLAKSYLTMATSKLYSHIGDSEWTDKLPGEINSYEWVDERIAYDSTAFLTDDIIRNYDTKSVVNGVTVGKMNEVYFHNFYPWENYPEILFDMQANVVVGAGVGTQQGTMASANGLGWNWIKPTMQLVQAYDPNYDIRGRLNTDQAAWVTDPDRWVRRANANYYFQKIRNDPYYLERAGYTNNNTPVNFPLMRLAEVYLMYAEALAGREEVDNPNGVVPAQAFEAVNIVARRSWNMSVLPAIVYAATNAGITISRELPYNTYTPYDNTKEVYSTASLTPALGTMFSDATNTETTQLGIFRNLILLERGLELCSESVRWYDLVRLGKLYSAVTTMTVVEGTGAVDQVTVSACKANIRKHHILRPIPARDIGQNANLIPNSGYSL